MSNNESFNWHSFRPKGLASFEICEKKIAIGNLQLKCILFALCLGLLNFNLIFPWSRLQTIKRVIFLLSVNSLLVLSRILNKFSYEVGIFDFKLPFLANILFFFSFAEYPTEIIKLGTTERIKLSDRIYSYEKLIFLLLNIAFSNFYINFKDIYANNRLIYTQIPGLFAYLKSKFNFLIFDSIEIFKLSGRLNISIFFIYIFLFNPLFKALCGGRGISIISFFKSSVHLFFYLIFLTFNNSAFRLLYSLIEYISRFNSSFYGLYTKLGPDSYPEDVAALEYHKIVLRYRHYEFKFKSASKEACMVEEHLIKEIANLSRILTLMEGSKNKFDANILITDPQPNNRISRRQRLYYAVNSIISKFTYKIESFVLTNRFNMLCEILPEIFEFIFRVREQENINLLNETIVRQFNELVERAREVSGRLRTVLLNSVLNDILKHCIKFVVI